ncbi:hypothetical protein IQ215_00725 [Cyanobacterium stanieri LEGE 03274]|uniref:ADP-ribosylglycohydrolase n=1 Tax=Cyanobacterium stanieri LEGE 03274 TaxID=1828756 RepID=A0ABR9V008_9CHRO|nr:hypothetical protein [Cyanobacterium stanieri]MBE9221210.1 hypothetical protein [Cyanobacterium stanieri LEGE 03274]
MQYFNQSALKGALWGALGGNYFSSYPHSQLFLNDDFQNISDGLNILFLSLKNISNNDIFSVNDWLYSLESHGVYFIDLNLEKRAIALIPLILYCYENPLKLATYLQEIKEKLLIDNLREESIFDLMEIFRLVLTKKDHLNWQTLINSDRKQLTTLCSITYTNNNIKAVEKQIKELYNPQEIFIYQAIYSFISLPNYVEISLLRSTCFEHQKQLTAIVTGLLLGLNNGYHSLPLSWRKYLQLIPLIREKNIDQLSQNFVDKWQGKYIKNPLLQT